MTLGLAALSVELPFLVACLLVQVFKDCPHCRHEWLSWPILAGAFPSYLAEINLHFGLSHLSTNVLRFEWGAFTATLIALAFLASFRSPRWRQILAGTLILSSGLAALAFVLIAS